jgi:hypothetical protein
MYTSDANGCRCIKDPLYLVNDYDFPTEYLPAITEYKEGLNNPNTYQVVKNTSPFIVNIPVSKAFSVQSQLLNNPGILNAASFNSLKANVLWTTNTSLISRISIVNPSPSSLQNLGSSRISVEIAPNQSGNAVITLHNGSVSSPVYWSWHIWVTDSPVAGYSYTTEPPVSQAVNYMNYVNKADAVLQTVFMDRNLGATDVFLMLLILLLLPQLNWQEFVHLQECIINGAEKILSQPFRMQTIEVRLLFSWELPLPTERFLMRL